MNIAFYVSGNAGRLKKILEINNSAVLDSIKLIFSDDKRNEFLDDMVAERSIEYLCFNFEDIIKTPTESKSVIMSNTLLSALKKHDIDYCFSFGDHLLVGDLLDVYENRIVNFHPSLLPMFPGIKAIDQAVEAGALVLGNTAHFIDAGIDTGMIIMQNILSVEVFNRGGYDAVLDEQLSMFDQIFKWLLDDRLKIVNHKVHIEGANYYHSTFIPGIEI